MPAAADQLKARIRDGEVVTALRPPVTTSRPALEAMKARVDDPNQYVGRVLGPAVKRLEK